MKVKVQRGDGNGATVTDEFTSTTNNGMDVTVDEGGALSVELAKRGGVMYAPGTWDQVLVLGGRSRPTRRKDGSMTWSTPE